MTEKTNMKVLLIIFTLLMSISSCKVSYQKDYVTEAGATSEAGIVLNAKVCLESAFDNDVLGVEMITDLNDLDLIPDTTPYGMSPWFHYSFNDVTLDSTILTPTLGPKVFVDWVLVEVYKDINGVMTYQDGQSGLLQYDGVIYDTFGVQGILFPNLTAGDYYINIIHRNHLSVGSHNPVALSSAYEASTFNIDFTDPATEYLDEATLVPVPYVVPIAAVNGTKCLRAGDINGDLEIDSDALVAGSDAEAIWDNINAVVSSPLQNVAILGYLNSDVNFDGEAQLYIADPANPVTDKSPDLLLVHPNTGVIGNLHGHD